MNNSPVFGSPAAVASIGRAPFEEIAISSFVAWLGELLELVTTRDLTRCFGGASPPLQVTSASERLKQR